MKLNEPERQNSEADFLAVGEACIATFWPASGINERASDNKRVLSRGDLNFCVHGIPARSEPSAPCGA